MPLIFSISSGSSNNVLIADFPRCLKILSAVTTPIPSKSSPEKNSTISSFVLTFGKILIIEYTVSPLFSLVVYAPKKELPSFKWCPLVPLTITFFGAFDLVSFITAKQPNQPSGFGQSLNIFKTVNSAIFNIFLFLSNTIIPYNSIYW